MPSTECFIAACALSSFRSPKHCDDDFKLDFQCVDGRIMLQAEFEAHLPAT